MDRGVVVTFDAEKGFGFIRSRSHREDVFVHRSAVVGDAPLRVGQRVTFDAEPSDRGPRATRVEPGRMGLSPDRVGVLALGVALVVATLGLHRLGLGWLGAWLLVANLATWSVFAWDKRQAGLDGRRVPEVALLGMALVGGSPAAILAMRLLRHKTRKPAFLIPFVGVVVLQVVLIVVAYRAWG